METPWGQSQYVKDVADGITQVSTAGHGGIKLSADRRKWLDGQFRFNTFAGGNWYEHDEDIAVVIAAWPELFGDEAAKSVVEMIRRTANDRLAGYGERWADVRRWLESPAGAKVRSMHDAAKERLAGHWRTGSMWGPPGKPGEYPSGSWGVDLRNETTGEHRSVVFGEYPRKDYYTSDEIAGLETISV